MCVIFHTRYYTNKLRRLSLERIYVEQKNIFDEDVPSLLLWQIKMSSSSNID